MVSADVNDMRPGRVRSEFNAPCSSMRLYRHTRLLFVYEFLPISEQYTLCSYDWTDLWWLFFHRGWFYRRTINCDSILTRRITHSNNNLNHSSHVIQYELNQFFVVHHENRRRRIVNASTTNASIKQWRIKDFAMYDRHRTNAIRMYNFNTHFVIECPCTRVRLGTVPCLTVRARAGNGSLTILFSIGESSKGAGPAPKSDVYTHWTSTIWYFRVYRCPDGSDSERTLIGQDAWKNVKSMFSNPWSEDLVAATPKIHFRKFDPCL